MIRDKDENIYLLNEALIASCHDSNKTMVASSTADYDELKRSTISWLTCIQRLVEQYEHVIDSKDKELSSLNEIIIGLNATPIITLKLARMEGEMFRTKTRTKVGKT